MSRFIFYIVTTIVFVSSLNAQNKTTLIQRINEIKSQNDIYFWDQYTHANADTAKINATKRLILDINSNRSEAAQLSVEEIMPHASYINIDRGNQKQYFVFIEKDAAITIKGGSSSMTAPFTTPVVDVSIEETTTVPPFQRSFVPDAFVQRIKVQSKNPVWKIERC